MSSNVSNSKTFINKHNIMLIFAIIFIIIALLGLLALSGVQTGSSQTSGLGSLVESSTGGEEDGVINPATEVVAEFLIVLLIIIGVAMLTYVMTINGASNKLIKKEQNYAALLINGNKNVDKTAAEQLKKEDVQYLINDLGLPSNTISEGLKALNKAAISVKNNYNKKYSTLKSKNSSDDDASNDDSN